MSLMKKNLLLLILILVICIFPLMTLKDAKFAGADGLAEEAITKLDPDYEPWFNSLYEPASGEIESLLFALQAAIGSGVLCFILGRMTAKGKGKDKNADNR